jgi:hypothetical protein
LFLMHKFVEFCVRFVFDNCQLIVMWVGNVLAMIYTLFCNL